MPAFSFTAPHVTLQQEMEERESLSEQMRQEIHNDLYGVEQPDEWKHPANVTPEMVELLEQAMEELPDRQKKEYVNARERSPKIVHSEADPRLFLRCERLNYKVLLWKKDSDVQKQY